MKIHFSDYDNLLSTLSEIQTVTDDGLNSDNIKSTFFQVKRHEDEYSLNIIGTNRLILFRKAYPIGKVNITIDANDGTNFNFVEDELFFGINSKELIDFLNTYKGSSLNYVEGVSINVVFNEKGASKITCVVYESENSDDKSDEEKQNSMMEFMESDEDSSEKEVKHFRSQWVFDGVIPDRNVSQVMHYEVPKSELIPVSNQMMHIVTANLIPLLNTDTSIYSFINFNELPQEEDDSPAMTIVFSNAFTTFLSNFVANEVFSGIRLNYKVVNFIDKIIVGNRYNSEDEYFEATKTKENIYCKWGSNGENEAFLTYDTKLTDFRSQLKARSKAYSFTINRFNLKDVIKRLSLINDTAIVHMDDSNDYLKLSNSKFEQEVPFIDKFNLDGLENDKFRIKPDVFTKVLIGDINRDAGTNDDIVVYINPDTAVLTFTTEDGFWQSLVRVKLIK